MPLNLIFFGRKPPLFADTYRRILDRGPHSQHLSVSVWPTTWTQGYWCRLSSPHPSPQSSRGFQRLTSPWTQTEAADTAACSSSSWCGPWPGSKSGMSTKIWVSHIFTCSPMDLRASLKILITRAILSTWRIRDTFPNPPPPPSSGAEFYNIFEFFIIIQPYLFTKKSVWRPETFLVMLSLIPVSTDTLTSSKARKKRELYDASKPLNLPSDM